MGPLFSVAIAVTGFTVVVAVAFFVLRLLCRASAFTLAIAFSVGCLLGIGLAAIAAMPVAGQILHSGIAVAAYVGSLCVVGLVGGGLGVHLASRVLTRRSSGRAFGTPLT